MPVRELAAPERNAEQKSLFNDLVAELQHPKEFGQPQILIRPMPRGGLRHVYVIWDRWKDCPPEIRGDIVREALERVRGSEYAKSVALALPVTVPEAIEMELLDFAVKPFRWPALDDKTKERAAAALVREGGSVLQNPRYPILAFATEEDARAAVARLNDHESGVDWDYSVRLMFPPAAGE